MSDSHPAMNVSREARAWSTSGYLMLLGFLALLALMVARIAAFAGTEPDDSQVLSFVLSNLLIAVLLILIASGFYMIQPNQAAAITLFGSYRGTDRNHGLRWVWPWMGKTKISVRANNLVSERIKVNDLRGNPIEMAAQVVWRVVDTAQALYDVDDYKAFVSRCGAGKIDNFLSIFTPTGPTKWVDLVWRSQEHDEFSQRREQHHRVGSLDRRSRSARRCTFRRR